MTKADAENWKTPLGYYERAIAELSKAREAFQLELQTIREVQASQADLKKQLQATKEQLETTQKTANEFQARVATAEKAANDAQSELQSLKENLQPIRLESGVFSGNVKITPGWSGVLCCDRKGSGRFVRNYIRFSQPFSNSPQIVLGLSYEDVYKGATHRIKVIATDIDNHGFFLEIHTWGHTQVWGADVNWLAYGY
jgi:septal ring factor EnvC (AmiA/AmiB activator)